MSLVGHGNKIPRHHAEVLSIECFSSFVLCSYLSLEIQLLSLIDYGCKDNPKIDLNQEITNKIVEKIRKRLRNDGFSVEN